MDSKSARFGTPNQRSVWLLYINDPSPFTRIRSTRVRVLPPSRCCAAFVVCTTPSAGVHRRSGEQVSGTCILEILHRERANKVFLESPGATAQRSSSWIVLRPSQALRRTVVCDTGCCTPSIGPSNRIVFVRSTPFVFPKAKAQYVIYFSIQCLIMFSELIILVPCR